MNVPHLPAKVRFVWQEFSGAGVVQHAIAFRLWRGLPFVLVRHRRHVLPRATETDSRGYAFDALCDGDPWYAREDRALRELQAKNKAGAR